jgi:hypothetical protein
VVNAADFCALAVSLRDQTPRHAPAIVLRALVPIAPAPNRLCRFFQHVQVDDRPLRVFSQTIFWQAEGNLEKIFSVSHDDMRRASSDRRHDARATTNPRLDPAR